MFTDNMVDLEHEPISNVISKSELQVHEKKTARSGVLIRRRSNSEEKESSYIQSNDEEGSLNEEETEEIPEIIKKKIKEMCF